MLKGILQDLDLVGLLMDQFQRLLKFFHAYNFHD
jgi:hypothetical protein